MTEPTSIPATFLIPAVPQYPVEIIFRHDALRMAVVDRSELKSLDTSWDACGLYVLFGYGSDPETYSAYVGKAPTGVRKRVLEHDKRREGWHRALLIARDARYGFTSADVGWLEGRLYEVLETAEAAEILNQVQPRDESLTDWDRSALDRLLIPIAGVMRALGFKPDPGTREAEAERKVRESIRRDWTDLHTLLERLPAGNWTSYGDLAQAIGSHARAIGSHLQTCGKCPNPHRVMNRYGQTAPGFAWLDPTDTRDPLEMLESEGLEIDENGRADPEKRFDAADLRELLESA